MAKNQSVSRYVLIGFDRAHIEASRLESRKAAEDIVERLHGRLVRGWNDAGCRISVRFADTAEQRELRVGSLYDHNRVGTDVLSSGTSVKLVMASSLLLA